MQLPKKEQVTACEYIECFNIFILGIQVKNTSRLEVYAFQKGSEQLSFAARQSLADVDGKSMENFVELESRYISEVYDTNDADFEDVFKGTASGNPKQKKALPQSEKLLGKLVLASKIKSIKYCSNGGYLCVGLQNGMINIYQIIVENSDNQTVKFRSCK